MTTDAEIDAEHAASAAASPPRCRCSHPASNHVTHSGRCWNVVCGCNSYRPKGEQ